MSAKVMHRPTQPSVGSHDPVINRSAPDPVEGQVNFIFQKAINENTRLTEEDKDYIRVSIRRDMQVFSIFRSGVDLKNSAIMTKIIEIYRLKAKGGIDRFTEKNEELKKLQDELKQAKIELDANKAFEDAEKEAEKVLAASDRVQQLFSEIKVETQLREKEIENRALNRQMKEQVQTIRLLEEKTAEQDTVIDQQKKKIANQAKLKQDLMAQAREQHAQLEHQDKEIKGLQEQIRILRGTESELTQEQRQQKASQAKIATLEAQLQSAKESRTALEAELSEQKQAYEAKVAELEEQLEEKAGALQGYDFILSGYQAIHAPSLEEPVYAEKFAEDPSYKKLQAMQNILPALYTMCENSTSPAFLEQTIQELQDTLKGCHPTLKSVMGWAAEYESNSHHPGHQQNDKLQEVSNRVTKIVTPFHQNPNYPLEKLQRILELAGNDDEQYFEEMEAFFNLLKTLVHEYIQLFEMSHRLKEKNQKEHIRLATHGRQ